MGPYIHVHRSLSSSLLLSLGSAFALLWWAQVYQVDITTNCVNQEVHGYPGYRGAEKNSGYEIVEANCIKGTRCG